MVNKRTVHYPPLAGEAVRFKEHNELGGNKLNRIVEAQECDATEV